MDTPAKKPQDHKKKLPPFSQVEGSALLKPLNEVPVEDAFDLMELFEGLSGEGGEFRISEFKPVLRVIREKFVADPEGFARFAVASNFEKVIELVGAYAQELSKDVA